MRLEDVEKSICDAANRLSCITEVLGGKIDKLVGDGIEKPKNDPVKACRPGLLGKIEDSLEHLNYKIFLYNEQVERLDQERVL